MSQRPLCFVLMPFGKKPGADGRPIDFDSVYSTIIAPAIAEAGMEPLRADEEAAGGIIHKPMFERLVLCDYAVADLTMANANVFYELGVRHAAKARSTVLLFADGHGRLPFDVAQLRALPYAIAGSGKPSRPAEAAGRLAEALKAAKAGSDKDSPLYQLLEDYPEIGHEKTDVFRRQVEYAADAKRRLAAARRSGRDAVHAEEDRLGDVAALEAGVAVDLYLSYRAVSAWDDMIRVAEAMHPVLRNTVLVREQLGFALNRAKRSQEAEAVLTELVRERGPSSETLGILGRVYKDRWEAAVKAGDKVTARGLLRQVVKTYREGFEADWRDAYPGINAVTFMQILDPDDPEFDRLQPVVRYAVERKIQSGGPDYWDHATLLELAVLAREPQAAENALADALALQREPWEPETTLKNIRMIRDARGDGDPARPWVLEIETALERAMRPA